MLKIKTVFVNKSHEKINKCVSHVQQNIVSMLSFVLMNVKKKKIKKKFNNSSLNNKKEQYRTIFVHARGILFCMLTLPCDVK